MWSNSLVLISENPKFDDIGNQISDESRKEIYCNVKSISRSEFYNASTAGLKPSLIFSIHLFEYNNEIKVEFNGVIYNVIRTYMVSADEIELTCEKVLGNGG